MTTVHRVCLEYDSQELLTSSYVDQHTHSYTVSYAHTLSFQLDGPQRQGVDQNAFAKKAVCDLWTMTIKVPKMPFLKNI